MLNEMQVPKNPITPVSVVANVVQSDYYSYDLQKLNNAIDDIHEWENLAKVQLAYHQFFATVIAFYPDNQDVLNDLDIKNYGFMIKLLDDLFVCFQPIRK